MKKKNTSTPPENNKKTKIDADSSENYLVPENKQEVEFQEISDIDIKSNEEIEQKSSNNHIQKDFFSKYLELKIPLPSDGSSISYLNCETLLSTIHNLYSNKTYKLLWLFDNNELTTTKSIFYQLLSPYWSTIQETPALNTQMSKLLIALINLQIRVSSKNKVFSELMGTLSLKQSWIELLLDYYHEQVNESYKSWLLSFLDSFVSERKNAFLSCVSLLDKKTQDNYINLSDTEANQVRELLNAFNNPCFTLTSTNGQYQLAVVNQENYEKLKQELRFSLFIKVSFSTHQTFLKKIFTEIVQNHPQKDGGIEVKTDKNTVRYLNSIYKPYLHLSTKTMGTTIEVIDSTNCLEIAKTFLSDISIKQIPQQESNSSPFITIISNNNRLDIDRSHSINQSSAPIARKSNERKKTSQVSTTNQTGRVPVTLEQSIVEKSKGENFLKLMKTILKKLPATTIFCKGTLSLTYVRDFNKLYNNILRAYCSQGTGVFEITVLNANLCLKLAEQLGMHPPIGDFQIAEALEMPQTNTVHDNQSEQLSIAHPSKKTKSTEYPNKKKKAVKFSGKEQSSETTTIQQTTKQSSPRQLNNQSQEPLSLSDNTELSCQISEALLMPQTNSAINDTRGAPELVNQSQEPIPLIDYTEPSFQISENSYIPQVDQTTTSEQESIAFLSQETESTTQASEEKKANSSEKNKSPQISVPPQIISQLTVESSTQSSIDKDMSETLIKLVRTIVKVLPSDDPIISCAGELPQIYVDEFNKNTKEIFQIHNSPTEKKFQLTIINPTLCLTLARRLGINNNWDYPSYVILNNLQTTTTTSNKPATVSITHQSPQSESTARNHPSLAEKPSQNTAPITNQPTLEIVTLYQTCTDRNTKEAFLKIMRTIVSVLPIDPVIPCEGEISQTHLRNFNKNCKGIFSIRSFPKKKTFEITIFNPDLCLTVAEQLGLIVEVEQLPNISANQLQTTIPNQSEKEFSMDMFSTDNLILNKSVNLEGTQDDASYNFLQVDTTNSIVESVVVAEVSSSQEFDAAITSTLDTRTEEQPISPPTNVELQSIEDEEELIVLMEIFATNSENHSFNEINENLLTNDSQKILENTAQESSSPEFDIAMNEEEILPLIENLATNNEINSQETSQNNTAIPQMDNNHFQFFSSNQKRQQTAPIPMPIEENESLFDDSNAQPLETQAHNYVHTKSLANSVLFFNEEPAFSQSQLEESISTYTEFEITEIDSLK